MSLKQGSISTRLHRSFGLLTLALVAAVIILAAGILDGRTPTVEAQIPGIPDECEPQDADWNICIVKVAVPSNTGADFDYEVSGDLVGSFTLEHGEGELISTNGQGEITVTEDPPPGWELVDIDCEFIEGDATWNFTVNINANSVDLDLISGPGFIVCFFYNELRETPTPTPTRTPTPTPTATPTETATPTATPDRPPHLGAFLAPGPSQPQQPPISGAPPTGGPAISPPATGDAGLK